MKNYTLKPKAVKAMQFNPGCEIPGSIETPSGSVFVYAPGGKLLLTAGCYVVDGIPGGRTVMSAADFEAAYDEANPAKKAKKDKTEKVSNKKVSKKKAAKK